MVIIHSPTVQEAIQSRANLYTLILKLLVECSSSYLLLDLVFIV